MELNITGDPGTGNTYYEVHQEFHISHVENLNPNATTVVNHYGDRPRDASTSGSPTTEFSFSGSPTTESSLLRLYRNPSPSSLSPSPALLERQRDDLLSYVLRLSDHVAEPYTPHYEQLWRDILAIDDVAAEIYNHGKQKNTTFNRTLVANILGMMKNAGLFGDITNTRIAIILEGTKDCSLRTDLAKLPLSRAIYDKVRTRIEESK